MKGVKLFIQRILFVFYTCAMCTANSLLASYAIKSIVTEYFAKQLQNVDIIQVALNQSKTLVNEVLNKVNGFPPI